MKKIAIIPARGGSKRIKRKNIRCFAGKPMITYALQAALESALFDDILVSTDDNEIAKIAMSNGASQIIRRPDSLADDFTGTSPVIRHAVSEYQIEAGYVEFVCCIYATAPFLNGESLIEGFEQLCTSSLSDFAFSVTTFPFPIQRALKYDNGELMPVDSEMMGKRSQDLPERYHDAGQFYWGRTKAWLDCVPMFGPKSLPVVMPRHKVQDIDSEEDWQRAELMYKAYIAENNSK